MSGSKVVKDREFVKTMMAYGVKSEDCIGWTPLHHAIYKKLPKMVEKILKFYEINELRAFLVDATAHFYFYHQDIEIYKTNQNQWQSLKGNFLINDLSADLASQGHWNDPDML